METLPAGVASVVHAMPDRIAVVDGERRTTYAAFWDQAQAFAHALRQAGLRCGDRVALLLPNRLEAATATYGAWLAGGVAVPLNVQARARDFIPWISHSGARFVVHEAGHADAIEAIMASPGVATAWALAPGQAFDAIDDAFEAVDMRPDDVAAIFYTSGTTGAPKGVTLTHRNLHANAHAILAYLELQADDRVLGVLPFYYAYGASVLNTHLAVGASVVIAPNLMFPQVLVDTLARERITGFAGVPSSFALLLDRVRLADHDLRALRYLTQAGGAMGPALARRLRDALPTPRLFVMYGQTEATSRLTWLPPERLDDKPGSVGIPVQGVELGILAEDGSVAATGESGEVRVRGANVMQGYWNNPEATAAVLRDGWLHTGDVGRLDEEGFLYLDGRRSDMIKTGAHRVHPNDVEEVVAEVPGVAEVAVVGIDDALLGQVVKAFVVAHDPPPGFDDRIKAHCRARLAPYKIPRFVQFVDALPRTASGKVRRAALLDTDSPSHANAMDAA